MRPKVEYAATGEVCTIRLASPEQGNAFDAQMIAEFEAAVARMNDDDTVRVAIVEGAGGVFCSGADLGLIEAGITKPEDLFNIHDRMFQAFCALSESLTVTIAAVGGAAIGGGFELAMACDIRLAGDGAVFALPESQFGIMPGAGGTARLPRLIGNQKALELLLTGRRLEPKEARDLGLVLEIHPTAQLDKAARAMATRLLNSSPQSMRQIKKSVHLVQDQTLKGALEFCQASALLLGPTDETARGLARLVSQRRNKGRVDGS